MIMTKTNFEKIKWHQARIAELVKQNKPELIERMESIDYHVDLDILALEGLEIENGLNEDISVRLVLSKTSGRFYLDIDTAFDGMEDNEAFKDEKRIKRKSHDWVPVELVTS